MKNLINLLNKIDTYGFLDVYVIISKPISNIHSLESIAFLTQEEAEQQCNYMNKKYMTNKYRVYKTCMKVI